MGASMPKGFLEQVPVGPTTAGGLCCLALSWSDRILAIRATDEVVRAVRDTIRTEWPKGTQIDEQFDKCAAAHKFKMKGTPWLANFSSATTARKLVMKLVANLRGVGWEMVGDFDINRVSFGRVLILRPATEEEGKQGILSELLVGLHGNDKVRVYQTADRDSSIHDCVRRGIESFRTIQKESEDNGTWEFKIKGNPWFENGEHTVSARQVLLGICSELEANEGYRLTKTINVSAKQGSQDALLFQKLSNDGWNRGEQREGMRAEEIGTFGGGRSTQVDYVGVSMNSKDRLRIFNTVPKDQVIGTSQFDSGIVDDLSNTITKFWPKGIQEQSQYAASHEWKLKGTPWYASGTATVDSRRLIAGVLQLMLSYGYEILPGVDCSRKLADSSTLIFRREAFAQRAAPPEVLCVSMHDTKYVRLSATDSALTDELYPLVEAALREPNLAKQSCRQMRRYGESWEFELIGAPFHTMNSGETVSVYVGCVLMSLLDSLKERGWQMRAVLDVSHKYVHTDNSDYKTDLGAMYFTKMDS